MSILQQIKKDCTENITLSQKSIKYFFKTDANQYASHDKFLGITMPNLRKIAKKYIQSPRSIIQELLKSQFNDHRSLALIILVEQFKTGLDQEEIYRFYLNNTKYINNWNLVDISCYFIVGAYLYNKDHSPLTALAKSMNIWERRIAIVSTLHFIRNNFLNTTFDISAILLQDSEDLIHKATGWMLREAGKKDKQRLISFLIDHISKIHNTTLRYAMEKFSKDEKQHIRNIKQEQTSGL